MDTRIKIALPEGFDRAELPDVTFEREEEILKYCHSCTKQPECKMNYLLRLAMGNNYAHWEGEFIAVDVPTPQRFFKITTKVLCTDYENPQLRLPGIPRTYSDGVEKLMEDLAREKEDCAELDREYDGDAFFKNLSFAV